MKKTLQLTSVMAFCVLSLAALNPEAAVSAQRPQNDSPMITLEIDYGGIRPARSVELTRAKNRTVLELLQQAAIVETRPAGKLVFVTSIDGVSGRRGEKAWYYTLEGRPAKELAYSKVSGNAKRITWTYKQDVCSWRVDGGPDPRKKEVIKDKGSENNSEEKL
ncbi:MAG: DUF4430 domain-containing protein [Candidatus Omnitrophota bacterium]